MHWLEREFEKSRKGDNSTWKKEWLFIKCERCGYDFDHHNGGGFTSFKSCDDFSTDEFGRYVKEARDEKERMG